MIVVREIYKNKIFKKLLSFLKQNLIIIIMYMQINIIKNLLIIIIHNLMKINKRAIIILNIKNKIMLSIQKKKFYFIIYLIINDLK